MRLWTLWCNDPDRGPDTAPSTGRRAWPWLGAVALTLAVSAPAVRANPFETRLDNGMRVVVKEDRRAPSVVHMVWYDAGAMDEVAGTSGVAHVLEHMMFKGTTKVGPGEFNKIVAGVGGRDNAFTSYDYTAYFQQVPADQLGRMMALEADRMHNLKLSDEAFAKEIEVIKEERRLRTEDKPRALVHEELMATAFHTHPYQRPVIGWMTDLDRMTAEDARRWYRSWYAPNNATLVVVGDVDHQTVFRQAAETYGAVPAAELPARPVVEEPPQRGMRRSVVKAPAELPYVALAWPTPTLRDPAEGKDVYALQVLAAVLDGYDGARLSRTLVRDKRIAQSAGAGYDGLARGPSLFYLDGAPAPGKTLAEVEAALRDEIQRIQTEGVDAQELARVKTQAVASRVYQRDSLMGQAMEIGSLAAVGLSWKDEAALLEGIRQVSAEDVKSVAQRYFSEDKLTVVSLDPLPLPAAPRRPAIATRH
ncbi:M16 family metallopeptidase [Denitromonas iodatirespirans]|uniref:Insulinase family protein n=1 Tax=Denitromonas iodatirespirans TaxID=2795389 RepID=A0A944D7F3_DENI1|nr:pitrilysin family protein [Denitromonas iodatirespirans]MBT0959676.1 insulinase family protein [Denitromonas iodatirespirans]